MRINKLGLLIVATFVAFGFWVACSSEAKAQTFVAIGPQYRQGAYGYYDGPKLEGAKSAGVFVEGQADFKLGEAHLVPRALASIDRVFPDKSHDYARFAVRPEIELQYGIGEGPVRLVASGGFDYSDVNKDQLIQPLVMAGAQAGRFRLTAGRLFPVADHGNLRGYRVRADYTHTQLFGEYYGLRASVEYEQDRSELGMIRYSGYLVAVRLGLLIGK